VHIGNITSSDDKDKDSASATEYRPLAKPVLGNSYEESCLAIQRTYEELSRGQQKSSREQRPT
jgi:hypothetical protein